MASTAVLRTGNNPNGNGRGATRGGATAAVPARPNGRAAPKSAGSSSSGEDDHKGSDGKRSLSKAERRMEQNRSAQRAFRERQMQYVKSLEEQLSKVADELADATRVREENSELLRLIRDLQRENVTLKQALQLDNGPDSSYDDVSESSGPIGTRASSSAGSDAVPSSMPDVAHVYDDVGDGLSDDLEAHQVYNLDKLKYEVGDEGSPAYEAVFGLLGPDGRLRTIDSFTDAPPPPAPADGADDDDDDAFVPLAAGTAPMEKVLGRRPSDGVGLAGPPPPLFPLATPPLSDASTPAYVSGILGFDALPREPPVHYDDSAADDEVPSLGLLPATTMLTPPNDIVADADDAVVVTAAGVVAGKRHLDESDIYVQPTHVPELAACAHTTALSRIESGRRDPVEEELCEKMREKALLGNVNPSDLNKSKFIKRTTAA